MSEKLRIRLNVCFVLAALWWIIGWSLNLINHSKPSEQSLLRLMANHPLASEPTPEQRHMRVVKIASQLNVLEMDDRHRVLLDDRFHRWVAQMTEPEKETLLQGVMAKGLTETMRGFGAASEERRSRWLNQARNELSLLQGNDHSDYLQLLDDQRLERLSKEGLAASWQHADLQTRIALEPILERIQSILQVPR